MAIIIMGGDYKGRKLATDTRGGLIRPTSGKVREALFSSLGDSVVDSIFVDLYAGSGAVGLEALSRGAREAILVEKHPQSLALLKANRESVLKADADKARIERADALAFCARMRAEGKRFDLVFADPPFADDFSGLREAVLGILSESGTAVVQFPSRHPPPWAEQAGKLRVYGESSLAFFTEYI